MFKKLLEIISSEKRSKTEQIDSNIIFASLLVRAARIDNEYSDVEKQQIDLIIKEKFLVPMSKAHEIRTYAEEFEQDIVDTVQITKKIKKNIPFEERQALAEDLWSIVLVDSIRSEDENSFMRTCIKLIGVNDVDSAIARRAVINRIKKNSP